MRVIAAVLPVDGGEEVAEQVTKAVQAVIDVTPVASQAFMEATIRQHGASPAQTLNNMQIELAMLAAPPAERNDRIIDPGTRLATLTL